MIFMKTFDNSRLDNSNYGLDRPLLKEKNKKIIDEIVINERWIRRKIIAKFVALRAKTYSYLIDDCSGDKKQKSLKSVS